MTHQTVLLCFLFTIFFTLWRIDTEFGLNYNDSKKLLQAEDKTTSVEKFQVEAISDLDNTSDESEGQDFEWSTREVSYESPNKEQTSNDRELNFVVIGDFGYTDGTKVLPRQKKVGDFIVNRVKQSNNHDFVISVGDNVYPYGLRSEDDQKAKVLFEDTLQMTNLGLEWHAILGKS